MRYLVIFISSLILLISIFISQTLQFYDGKMHVVFCNVGQGDAVFIRTPNRNDILIDGGPNDKILACLENNLPFWDRQIDAIFLTHPHADHLTGLTYVLDRYEVRHYLSTGIEGNTEIYRKLRDFLAEEGVSAKNLKASDRLIFGQDTVFQILWPTATYLENWREGAYGDDPNSTSLVIKVSFGSFDVLFTGDAESEILNQISLSPAEILKVPHQGSKGALTSEDLERIKPEIGIIFVGKNSYGHPSREIIDLLNSRSVKTLRTDRDGTVKIVTDGKSWSVKK